MSSSYFRPQPELFGMRVVKYIRCSHDGQVLHGETLEAQDALLDEFIEVNKMILVDTFIDEALTARKKFTRRKEFVRLLDGVRAHAFELILFTKLDRWFRNIGDYHKIQEVLEANGVQWKAITESYDTTTTNGRLHINIRLSVAQDECDRDSDRIKDVFAYKLKNKSYISGNLPRGLKLDSEKHVIIDPEWNSYALDMFDRFESTCSMRNTQLFLQDKYNVRVSYSTIVRALKNTLFMGEYRGDPEFCVQMISRERFFRIQKLIQMNVRERSTKQFYIFSGLLVCGTCQHKLSGASVHQTLVDGTPRVYKSYRCNYHAESTLCDNARRYRERDVEDYVLQHVVPALSSYVAKYEVNAAAAAKKDPDAEIVKVERKIQKLYDLFMDDLIDKAAYKKEYDKFRNEIEKLKKRPVLPVRNLDHMKELLSGDWKDVYSTFSEQEKNVFWKSFVHSITVYEDGTMDIIFL